MARKQTAVIDNGARVPVRVRPQEDSADSDGDACDRKRLRVSAADPTGGSPAFAARVDEQIAASVKETVDAIVASSVSSVGSSGDVQVAPVGSVDGQDRDSGVGASTDPPPASVAGVSHSVSDGSVPAVAAPVAIRTLCPLVKCPWTLVAQVVSRGPVRTWDTVRGSGRLFDFLLVDSAGDTIKATVFNEGVDVFDSVIQSGILCSLSGGKIKTPNRAFSSAKYELTFDGNSGVCDLSGGGVSTFSIQPLGRSIGDLGRLKASAAVTLVGVVAKADASKRVTTSKGKSCVKRDFIIVDDSMNKVVCTIWGNQALEDISAYEGEAVLLERAVFSDYQGRRSINVSAGAAAHFKPALPQAERLCEWFAQGVDLDDFAFLEVPGAKG